MLRKSTLIAAMLGVAVSVQAVQPVVRGTRSTMPGNVELRTAPRKASLLKAAEEAPQRVSAEALKAPAQAYTLPYLVFPTKDFVENECVIIDANDDARESEVANNTWAWMASWEVPICWYNEPNSQADDWLVLPAINFPESDKIYRVTVGARGTSNVGGNYEVMEVRIGKTPTVEGMERVAIPQTVIPYSEDFEDYTGLFGVPEAGDYYIAIRSCSPRSWRLPVNKIKVEATVSSALLPDACTDLVVTPDPKGELKAKVSFKLSTYAINGAPLPANQQVTAVIKYGSKSETVTGTPGQVINKELEMLDGFNTIIVVPSNEAGEGIPTSVFVRCGLDVPAKPELVATVSEDNYTLTINWEPVTTGANDGIIDPATVVYDVYAIDYDNNQLKLVEEGLTRTSYVVQVQPGTPLSYVDVCIGSRNQKGYDSDVSMVTELLGDPYKLPVDETLEGQTLHYNGLTIDTPSEEYDNSAFQLGDPAQLDVKFTNSKQGALLGMHRQAKGGKGHITLPKFSTVGVDQVQVILPMFLYNYSPTVEVSAKTNTGESVVIGKVTGAEGSGWTNLLFTLPAELLGKKCVSVALDITFPSSNYLFLMEGYTIKKGAARDLAVSNVSVSSVVPGEETTVTAIVSNNGANTMDAPELKGRVNAGGQQVAELEFVPESTGSMALLETRKYTAKFTLNSADYIGSTINVTVNQTTADEEASNDSMTTQAQVKEVAQPIIRDLSARYNDESGAITLNWSCPVTDEAVDGFEFLRHGDYSSQLGRWKNYDFDGKAPYTLGELANVNIADDTKAKGFQVISIAESGLGAYEFFGYNNSDKMLMAFSPQEAEADDWLVSPRVVEGTEVSFMYDIVSSDYPEEKIEVLYSTTNDDPDSFKKVLKTVTKSMTGWEEVRVQLPDDACYFAIRYCSDDKFGILIDEISYYPAEFEYNVASYAVLRDEQTIATLPATATSYVDENTTKDAAYRYHIVPTYTKDGKNFEGLRSNTASIVASGVEDVAALSGIYGTKGGVVIEGRRGEVLTVSDAQGRIVRRISVASDRHIESIPAGFYIVGTSKVIVR